MDACLGVFHPCEFSLPRRLTPVPGYYLTTHLRDQDCLVQLLVEKTPNNSKAKDSVCLLVSEQLKKRGSLHSLSRKSVRAQLTTYGLFYQQL